MTKHDATTFSDGRYVVQYHRERPGDPWMVFVNAQRRGFLASHRRPGARHAAQVVQEFVRARKVLCD